MNNRPGDDTDRGETQRIGLANTSVCSQCAINPLALCSAAFLLKLGAATKAAVITVTGFRS